jgi:hypothetical protein
LLTICDLGRYHAPDGQDRVERFDPPSKRFLRNKAQARGLRIAYSPLIEAVQVSDAMPGEDTTAGQHTLERAVA